VVSGADEAVALANDTGYGLVNSVVTADPVPGRGNRPAAAGRHGLGGRSGGDANLEEFTERRRLTINPGQVHYPY
jgi:benzaldehyde dehydrogenase (NAD)